MKINNCQFYLEGPSEDKIFRAAVFWCGFVAFFIGTLAFSVGGAAYYPAIQMVAGALAIILTSIRCHESRQ